MSKLKQLLHKNHLTLGVVFVCVVILLLIPKPEPVEAPIVDEVIEAQATTTVPMQPARISIPKLNLEADFSTPLGLKANGEVEVPSDFDTVGWYQYSPLPGEFGPAVVLGHVDSFRGPAVFYSLGQLSVGDEILITDEAGETRRFVVERSELFEQNNFPSQAVYGNIDHEGLRLITCSGWYDKSSDRYSHNRVVFARLVR